ncbi:MAG: hypothetical protein Q9208_004115 [Pyrenodesmia sp. 3 TL-2023]
MSSLVSSRAGKHIMLVDMMIIKQDQLVTDGIHPNDAAYKIMASQWHDGIKKAVALGWINAPTGPDPKPDPRSNNQNCRMGLGGTKMGHQCSGGMVWTQLGQIAPGDGMNGNHRFNPYWVRLDADPIGRGGSQVVLADLRGKGRADRIFVNPTDGSLSAWLNDGDGTYFVWNPANNGQPILDGKCTLGRMRFTDLTGSGKVDVVCIVGSNSIVAYFNQYSSSGGFKWDGPHQISNGVAGANYDSVSFMDLDGNGRDDMIIKGPNGDFHAILNFGKPSRSTDIDWHDVGQAFSGTGSSNLTFADLNNDGRDDIVVFNADGSFYSFLNIRGWYPGRPGWVRQDTIKPPQSWAPPNLRMSDVTGDGKADYIMIAPQSASLAVFANNGSGDASVAGDGIWFADMDGDGLDDKVWISVDGHMSVWLNGQANAQAPNGWDWFAQNERKPISTGIAARREQYRLADIDGDGKADILIVDVNTRAISAWLNNGANMTAGPQGWNWTPVGQIWSSSGDAAGIRFADVTGDGKADLISLDQASGMTIYRNDYDPSWRRWSWMKITNAAIELDAHSPKDLRFADMDGDQKADAVWVHPWDGTIAVRLNKDASKQEGWVRSTTNADTVGPSHLPCAGENVMFARISVPYGRADYILVTPHDGSLAVWKNGCTNYAPGSSSMTDNANGGSSASRPEPNAPSAASVSCGDLVVPAGAGGGGGGDTASSTSMSSLAPGSTGKVPSYTSTRTIAPPVSQIADGQIQGATVPVSTAQPPVTQTSKALVQWTVVSASDTKASSSGSKAVVASKSTIAIVKGGLTLVAGAPPVTVSGTTYSLPTVPAMVVINGRTSSIPTTSGTAPQSAQGAPPTTSSKVVSVIPVPIAGSQASSQLSQTGVAASQPSAVVVAGQTLHENATTGFVVGGQSIRPGSSAVVVSGHTLSLDKSAHLIEDGTTIRLPQSTKASGSLTTSATGPPTTSVTAPAVVAVGKASVVVESSGFVVGNQTVRPGGPQVVVSSHTLSLDKSAKLVVDGSTTRLPQSLSTSTSTNTITPATTSTTGSQTVRPGGTQVVVSSRTLSLDKSGNLLQGTSTGTGTSSVSSSVPSAASATTSAPGPDVYYDGSWWKERDLKVSCDAGAVEDPCTIMVPPSPLNKPTTYSSVVFETTVEVACPRFTVFTKADGTNSTSTSWSSTEVATKLTIPAITSDSIEYWNQPISAGAKEFTFTPTPSFDVQTITTTEDPKVCGQTGVAGVPEVKRTFLIAGAAVVGAAGVGEVAKRAVKYIRRDNKNEQGGGGRGGGGGGPRGKKCGDSFGPFKIFFKAVFCKQPCILNCPPGWELPHPPDWYSPYKPRNPPLPSPPMPPPLPYPTPPPGPGNPPNNPPNKPTPTDPKSQPDKSSQRSSSRSSSQSSSSSSCNTSTVTDIVKSCGTITSGSTSCRTISTIVSRGCSITAKTITTSSASACPRITIDPNEDQGEDGTPPSTTSKSCSTSAVTNVVVSCPTITSGSTSCQTVSTSVVRGCSITAKTTTTTSASSCPRITLDPNEDQGEDGTPPTTTTSASCSLSSTVTNAVVSCAATSGSTSCKTVSTSVVRGCSITAKTTTTTSASSCPRITLDPNEDQGEDGDDSAGATSSSSSKTSSSSSKTTSSTKLTSTSTTASTTVSSTSTTSSEPPKPTFTPPFLPKFEFAVGYFRDQGRVVGTRAAIYYNKQREDDSYVCRDNAAIWEEPKTRAGIPAGFHIGPFDAQLWTNCNYDRPNAEESGGLRCNGAGYVGNGTCQQLKPPPDIDCSSSPEHKAITWTTLSLCTMEPPQIMDPLPALPDFCFSSTKLNGDIKLEPGSTITTLDRGGTEDLIKSACDKIENGRVEQHKETERTNPNIRIVVAAARDASANVNPDKQVCNDRFTQLFKSCE